MFIFWWEDMWPEERCLDLKMEKQSKYHFHTNPVNLEGKQIGKREDPMGIGKKMNTMEVWIM